MKAKYVVVASTSLCGLESEVNEMMENGFVCMGGIAVESGDEDLDSVFHQAMLGPDESGSNEGGAQ